MTDWQKDQIQTMRRQGLSYVKIGQALGISDNTVRSFCRRNQLGDPVKNTISCQYCGKPIKIIPKQKPRKFCSDRCRTAWWNNHREQVKQKAFYHFTCSACGREFTAYGNAKRKYCSHKCYIADRFGKEIPSEKRCSTPTIDNETIQRMFRTAYNQLMGNRAELIADCQQMRKELVDFTALDEEIAKQREETQLIAEMVQKLVKENAAAARSQDAYRQKYETLTEQYEAAMEELERLQNLRTRRKQQDKAMSLFVRTLKKQPDVLEEWDDTIWTMMVEKAIVHRDSSITFVFYNGNQITVGA